MNCIQFRILEVDWNILFWLPDEQLDEIIITDKHYAEIGRSNEFWRQKLNLPNLPLTGEHDYKKIYKTLRGLSLNDKLINAAKTGYYVVIQQLLNLGEDVHVYDDSVLCRATKAGHIAVVKLLIENGADINADDGIALRWAAENGHVVVA